MYHRDRNRYRYLHRKQLINSDLKNRFGSRFRFRFGEEKVFRRECPKIGDTAKAHPAQNRPVHRLLPSLLIVGQLPAPQQHLLAALRRAPTHPGTPQRLRALAHEDRPRRAARSVASRLLVGMVTPPDPSPRATAPRPTPSTRWPCNSSTRRRPLRQL